MLAGNLDYQSFRDIALRITKGYPVGKVAAEFERQREEDIVRKNQPQG